MMSDCRLAGLNIPRHIPRTFFVFTIFLANFDLVYPSFSHDFHNGLRHHASYIFLVEHFTFFAV
jgi:hypothetical protein